VSEIERHGSGGRWEPIVGYCRVIRAGGHVWVAGTTATTADGAIAGLGDPYVQVRQTVDNIAAALARVCATLADVVRTRVFLVDGGHFDEFARAHAEAFGDIRPVNTTVIIAGLPDPRMLVEIEVEAYVADGA
jgi:enamine deaminase RidA (YjgF/YER057c/UK114 family)